MALSFNNIKGISHQERSEPGGRKVTRTGVLQLPQGVFLDASNGFPGPLPSQGSCRAKLADSWSARAGLPQLVYFSKQLIAKARLGHRGT